jgi:hypothetical protein
MANAAVQPEVSPGFRTSITRSLFSARHDLDGDRNQEHDAAHEDRRLPRRLRRKEPYIKI